MVEKNVKQKYKNWRRCCATLAAIQSRLYSRPPYAQLNGTLTPTTPSGHPPPPPPQAHHSPTLNNDRHFKCVPMLTFNRNQIKFYCNNSFWNARSRTRRNINDRTDDATGVLILAVYGGSDFSFLFYENR